MLEYLKTFIRLKNDERAVTALEYALIAGLIAVVIIGGVTTLGTSISAMFTNVGADVSSA